MGKRNASEALEHSAATTPQKKQRLQDAVEVKPSVTETPPQTYTLTKELVEDTVLLDLNLQKWRVGQPVGAYIFFHYVQSSHFPFLLPPTNPTNYTLTHPSHPPMSTTIRLVARRHQQTSMVCRIGVWFVVGRVSLIHRSLRACGSVLNCTL